MSSLSTASIQFIAFGLAVVVSVNLHRSRAWRSAVLLISSLVFLVLIGGDFKSLLPLAAFLALGYGGLWLIRKQLHGAPVAAVILIIGCYTWLKKYPVVPQAYFLPFAYLTAGLSYIFFRVLHLLIDSAQNEDQPHIGLGSYLRYTLNFTTFESGPIQRIEEFDVEPLPLDPGIVARQLERIVSGFFKVNIVAMLLLAIQQNAFEVLAHRGSAPDQVFAAARVLVVYPFFLYANFSGYIDIVIALARLMGLELPENFKRPFAASSFLDFWNRWHITLSTWLKTYVYNPLLTAAMRRIDNQRMYPYLGVLCFFVTFFLVGIWHGRTSEFAVFGLLQGGGVAINKLWQIVLAEHLGNKRYRSLARHPLYVALGRGLTFSWFAFTLLWFWAGWHEIGIILRSLTIAGWLGLWTVIWFMATMSLASWEWARGKLVAVSFAGEPLFRHHYLRVAYVSTLLLVSLVITVLLNQAAPDIVYKAF